MSERIRIDDLAAPELTPLQQGATKGVRVDLDTMVKDFFVELDLDRQTALPPRELAEELGIASYME